MSTVLNIGTKLLIKFPRYLQVAILIIRDKLSYKFLVSKRQELKIVKY